MQSTFGAINKVAEGKKMLPCFWISLFCVVTHCVKIQRLCFQELLEQTFIGNSWNTSSFLCRKLFISNSRNSPSCALDCQHSSGCQLYVVHHSILLFSALHHLKRKGIVCSQTTERSFFEKVFSFYLGYQRIFFQHVFWHNFMKYRFLLHQI